MTDLQQLHILQAEAINVLLEDTFTHINADMHERYVALGKENARLLQNREIRFIHKGNIYPPNFVATIPYGSQIPTLHYSLLSELDMINQIAAQADFHSIKNFFVAAISQSHNCIVLEAVLPTVLINNLKNKFGSRFKFIDSGVFGSLQQEPLFITQQNIAEIKKHYSNTITTLQHMLMDKLLLQS